MSDHPDDIVDTPPRPPLAMAPKWPDMAYWCEVAMHHGAEAQRLRTELAFARQLIAELQDRPPLPVSEPRNCTCHPDEAPTPCQHKYAFTDCVKAAPPAPAPFPARALRTWR